jgi:hypothetical protein
VGDSPPQSKARDIWAAWAGRWGRPARRLKVQEDSPTGRLFRQGTDYVLLSSLITCSPVMGALGLRERMERIHIGCIRDSRCRKASFHMAGSMPSCLGKVCVPPTGKVIFHRRVLSFERIHQSPIATNIHQSCGLHRRDLAQGSATSSSLDAELAYT